MRPSFRGETVIPIIDFKPEQTSAQMVDSVAAWILVSHRVQKGWHLEHFDVKRSFLHDKYKNPKLVHICEIYRADRIYKHGENV